MTLIKRSLQWALPATPAERVVALWAFGYFFMLLAGYYVLRPLRDQMGIAGGVKALPWMFVATFVALLVLQPIYGALVKKLPRRWFIPIVYQFFVANLGVFWLLLTLNVSTLIVARVFFVWVSVFNFFAVAVFWSLMADLFTSDQGKRLFGFIGAGGTAGGLLGPLITIGFSVRFGPTNLMLVAIVFLELAVFCFYRLVRRVGLKSGHRHDAGLIGGSMFSGFVALFRSRYLLGVAVWVSFLSFGGTILYLEQANIVAVSVHGAASQTRLFASIDLAVGLLTLATQVLATGQLLKRFGTGASAGALPAVYIIGFIVLALAPSLAVVFCLSGGAALDELRHCQSGAPSVLHGGGAGREIQGEEYDRRGGASRLRCRICPDVRRFAGARFEDRRNRAVRPAGRNRMAHSFHAPRTHAGTPRRRVGRGDANRVTSG